MGNTGDEGIPAVDLEILRSQLRKAGVEVALGVILETFLASAPERVTALGECLASGSAEEVSSAAHALKSSAGAIGAGPLAALLERIEEAGTADDLTDRRVLADQVRSTAESVYAELRAFLAAGRQVAAED